MEMDFKNIFIKCKSRSFDEIVEMQGLKGEDVRKREYMRVARKEAIRRSGYIEEKLKIFLGKLDAVYEEWFEWSQCKNPSYNKYYKILLRDIKDHIQEYSTVYDLLEDGKSKRVFEDICAWRLSRESKYLIDAYSISTNEQYLEPFEHLTDKEIFVDCGGYIGDSTLALIKYCGGVLRAYVYEADIINMTKAKANLKEYNVIYRDVGVGEKEETLYFQGGSFSSSVFVEDGNEKVNVVSIDNDISEKEKISFLKMDIEGMEKQALKGAKIHIQSDRPVLAVCVYHKPEDVWEIPIYISRIVGSGYRFFLRHYTYYHGETVFYAVPKERFEF